MSKWLYTNESKIKFSDAVIGRNTIIKEDVEIESGVIIENYVVIDNYDIIKRDSMIGNNVFIKNRAVIEKGATIADNTVIPVGALIGEERKNVTACISLHGFDIHGITGFICDDGLIVTIGFMVGHKGLSITEIRKKISKKYPPKHIYFDALNLIEKWYKERKKK